MWRTANMNCSIVFVKGYHLRKQGAGVGCGNLPIDKLFDRNLNI